MATKIVATGEVKAKLSTEDYLALVDGIGYPAQAAGVIRPRVEAGDPGARFTVYGTALRKGLIARA